MDKYLVKIPRNSPSPKKSSPAKRRKQATLESLAGVVVIEDIERCKRIFQDPEQTSAAIASALETLSAKKPSKEIIITTKIGRLVKKLRSHENKEVSSLAKKVYEHWKGHLVKQATRTSLEVKFDDATIKMRNNARRALRRALQEDKEDGMASSIELEIFRMSKNLLNNTYKRTARRLALTIQNDEALRSSVMQGAWSVAELVATNKR